MILAIALASVLVIGGAAAFIMLGDDDDKEDPYAYFDGAGLKALGNINKDNVIDSRDYDAVKSLIDGGASVGDNPLADANNDGILDEKDLETIKKIMDKEPATLWHINYHDVDSNGTMDKELVSTKVPVTSTIMTGSSNNFMLFTLLGIGAGEVVKGACFGSTNDSFLYKTKNGGNGLLDVTQLGTKSYEIEFENGKIGSSNIIKEEKVTCLVTDWNRIYIDNESAFETGGVDVVRIAAASFVKEDYTHSIALLGQIFSKSEEARHIIDLYDGAAENIRTAVSKLSDDQIKRFIASSTTSAVSSEESDYTAVGIAAGGRFALSGYDFGGSSVIYVNDNLGIFDTREYKIDSIMHIRTGLSYNSKPSDIANCWAEYANGMSLWEHAYDGQVLISGSIPVPCRVAYAAYAMYGNILPELSESWANEILSSFEANYHGVDMSKTHNGILALRSYEFSVTFGDDVTVKDGKGAEVVSGAKFPYGTELSATVNVVDPSKTLVAEGSALSDGKFAVVNNIAVKYVPNKVLEAQSAAASKLVELYSGKTYMESAVANKTPTGGSQSGTVTLTNQSYVADAKRTSSISFAYYDSVGDAKAAFDNFKADGKMKKPSDTGYRQYDVSSIVDGEDNDIYLVYSGGHKVGSAYTGSTIYVTAYYKNIVLTFNPSSYISHYTFDTSFHSMTAEEITEYFTKEVKVFAESLEAAMKAAVPAS